MENFLSSLLTYGFPIQFFGACVILMADLDRRSHFWGRVAFCALCHIVVAYLFMRSMPALTVLRPLQFFLIYGMQILTFAFCCKISIWDVLFGVSCGHAIQHLVYVSSAAVQVFLPMSKSRTVLLEAVLFAIIAFVCWKLFCRKLPRSGRYQVSWQVAVRSLIIILLFGFALNLISDHFYRTIGSAGTGMKLICKIYAALCCLFVLWIQTDINEKANLEAELRMQQMLWNQQREQYSLSRENIDLINQKCHDLKHQLNGLRFLSSDAQREEKVREIEKSVMIYDSVVKTGNQVLDTILTERSLACEKEGISWTCMADGAHLDFMDRVDLYTILGNALDNAMECVRRLEDPQMRVVTVSLYPRDHFSVLQVENYYSGEIQIRNGLPVSTKADRDYHGFGISSIRSNVAKYGGTISISTKDHVFSLSILIPIP